MDERTEILAGLRWLLNDQRFCVLATGGEAGPYASLVAFAATPDLRHLVFATGRATRKFHNLVGSGRAALLVDDRSNRSTDLRRAMAATAAGRVTATTNPEREPLESLLLEKHPELTEFVRSEGAAVVRVDVETYYVVTRFQNVLEFHVGDLGLGVDRSDVDLGRSVPAPAASGLQSTTASPERATGHHHG